MTELERYQQWCEQAPLDEAGRAALAAMQNDETERKGCFGAELSSAPRASAALWASARIA